MIMRLLLLPTVAVFFIFPTLSQGNPEIVTTLDDQQSISLTIYNNNLALIRDSRRITLPGGIQTLAFKEISSKIQPETAVLKGGSVDVIEQNYEFDLLSPTSLLQKYVGKQIRIVRHNPKTGEEKNLDATVLSTTGGVVLKIGNNIETAVDGRLIYPDVPANLREKPTLTMLVEIPNGSEQVVELSYLTGGLTWKADYIAELNESEDRLDMIGWVTLTNSSGASYVNSRLQLVAGDINRVRPDRTIMPMALEEGAVAMAPRSRQKVQQESLFEYHLYTVERPTTILDNQSKQIALLQENDAKVSKELLLISNNQSYYWGRVGEITKSQAVDVFLRMKNDKESNLGLPKPAGVVRVYKADSAGFSQFLGEDRIQHTPENEIIKIKLGRAFDVTADRIQTDFKLVRGIDKNQRIHESEYEITLKNAKTEDVKVTVEEMIPGDWQILSESQQHTKENATTVSWIVKVKAKESTTLTYRVRTEL